MSEPWRVLVLGTGAMATAFGAALARRGGIHVTLAGTWRDAIAAFRARGAVVYDAAGEWRTPLAAVPLEDAGPSDVVLVLAKSHQTTVLAPVAARAAGARGVVVTLQNGLGHRAVLERAAGPGRVAVGVTTSGATLIGPGEARMFAGQTTLGEEAPTREAVHRLAEALAGSGIATRVTAAVDALVWHKLAVNCSANPLTALQGCRNGELLADPGGRARLRAAAREVGDVAAALGIALGEDPADAAVRACEATGGNRSSMLQDVTRGARTEIDALNGAVAAEARRLGVAVPIVETLWRQVRALEGRPVRDDEAPPAAEAGAGPPPPVGEPRRDGGEVKADGA